MAIGLTISQYGISQYFLRECNFNNSVFQEGTVDTIGRSVGDRPGNRSVCCAIISGAIITCIPLCFRKEQLVLWGGVLAIGLVIALLCCYFWC